MVKTSTPDPCSECGGQMRRGDISEEFEREVVSVVVSGIRALKCEKCGEVYFEPGSAQAMSEAVNGLFAIARANRQHKGKITAATNLGASKGRRRKAPISA